MDNPDEVSFSEEVLKGYTNIAVLHNHRDASPPGAEDWANFIEVASLREMVIVTPEHIFTLTKTESHRTEPFKRVFSYFLAKIETIRRVLEPSRKFADLDPTVREQLLWDTNLWMSVHFSIHLTREVTP